MMRRDGGPARNRTEVCRVSTGRNHQICYRPEQRPQRGSNSRRRVEGPASWPLDDGGDGAPEPSSGIEPEPPVYGTGALPTEL